MREVLSVDAAARERRLIGRLLRRARDGSPTLAECGLAALSALLLVLAYPDFELWPLAWVGFVPLFAAVARRPRARPSFLLGWLTGTLFFYASCHWLTYPMINYGGVPAWAAYPLLLPGAFVVGIFPGLCALAVARACARWGAWGLWLAPFAWVAAEWARLGVTGQLWNAVGYSQAYVPELIQAARVGGVYAVGFLVVAVNAAITFALLGRGRGRALTTASLAVVGVALTIFFFSLTSTSTASQPPSAVVVAVQPNVIPDFNRPAREFAALADQHFELSAHALDELESKAQGATAVQPESVATQPEATAVQPEVLAALPRVVIWPESPMNFRYAGDTQFRERVTDFTRGRRASLIFNSLEPAPGDGGFNAAVLVNEEGRLAVQYDKIRLMPFGEYVPLPRWLPGAQWVRALVGEFTPGTRYTLMPLGGREGAPRAGVFICLESAYPHVTRRFAGEGADVLVEITNDAYQGDTAVARQHMANAVLRAVETGRTLLRVTNTGISARLTPRGEVLDATPKFQPAVRTWAVARAADGQTFYTKFGDLFVAVCTIVTVLATAATFKTRRGAVARVSA